MKKNSAWICAALLAFAPFQCSAEENLAERKPLSPQNWSKLREGDIVFIRSRSVNALLIAALSNINASNDADTVFTHCGIVFKDGNDAKLKIYEGAGRGRYLTVGEWREAESTRKVNGKETSKPLHNIYVRRWKSQGELENALGKVLEKAKALHDTAYDNGFCWTDTHAYCSELVWKAYDAGNLVLGTLPNMAHYVDNVSKDLAQKINDTLEKTKDEYRDGRVMILTNQRFLPKTSSPVPH